MQLEYLSRWEDGSYAQLAVSLTRSDLEDQLEQLESSLVKEAYISKVDGEVTLKVYAVEDA